MSSGLNIGTGVETRPSCDLGCVSFLKWHTLMLPFFLKTPTGLGDGLHTYAKTLESNLCILLRCFRDRTTLWGFNKVLNVRLLSEFSDYFLFGRKTMSGNLFTAVFSFWCVKHANPYLISVVARAFSSWNQAYSH